MFAPKDTFTFTQSVKIEAVFSDTAELVANGEFLMLWSGWTRYKDASLKPVYSVRDGQACLLPGGKGTSVTSLQFYQPLRPMVAGVDYRLKFSVKSAANRVFRTLIRDNASGWTIRQKWSDVAAGPSVRDYSFDFRLATGTDIPRLTFELGGDSSEVCLDHVSLRAIPPNLVEPTTFKEEGVVLASVRDRLSIQAQAGAGWELRSIDGRMLLGGVFEQGGKQVLPDIPRATSFLVVREPKGQVRTFRVVRF